MIFCCFPALIVWGSFIHPFEVVCRAFLVADLTIVALAYLELKEPFLSTVANLKVFDSTLIAFSHNFSCFAVRTKAFPSFECIFIITGYIVIVRLVILAYSIG